MSVKIEALLRMLIMINFPNFLTTLECERRPTDQQAL